MAKPYLEAWSWLKGEVMDANQKRPRQWYVVQVASGNEGYMCRAIKQACAENDGRAASEADEVGLKDCFSPRFESRKKRLGKWYDVSRALMPGYVIAIVRNPERLAQAMRKIDGYSHILASDETYTPLNDAERDWLKAQASDDGRTIPLSFGYKDDDGKVVVSKGPLKGYETMIAEIDRKNCIAKVEFHAGQITFKTCVGLVVLPNGKVVQEG